MEIFEDSTNVGKIQEGVVTFTDQQYQILKKGNEIHLIQDEKTLGFVRNSIQNLFINSVKKNLLSVNKKEYQVVLGSWGNINVINTDTREIVLKIMRGNVLGRVNVFQFFQKVDYGIFIGLLA